MDNNLIQGSDEWLKARLGKFTASNFGKLFMGKTTGGYNDLIMEVAYKRLTGESPESFKSEWMQRGNDLESEARLTYCLMTDNIVIEDGFNALNDWVGCSPDGLINEDGMVEIKCPKYTTLMNLHLKPKIAKDYYWQMQGQLWIYDRKWCDYFVYHPKLKPFMQRVERNNEDIEKLKTEIELAKEKVIEIITKLEN